MSIPRTSALSAEGPPMAKYARASFAGNITAAKTFSLAASPMVLVQITEQAVKCDICNEEASIFQVLGNYCLGCWQTITHTDTH